MSVLQIVGLKKTLGSEEILSGIDLRLEAGEKVGCVGRNGGGKTTLLRVIEGELPSDGGTLQLARGSRIGYVAQRPRFPDGTSCDEWDFWRGECGQEHSFCARQGGHVVARTEGSSGSTGTYAICTLPNGTSCKEQAFSQTCRCE